MNICVRSIASAAFLLGAVYAFAKPLPAAAALPIPVDGSCVNERVPPEILDGAFKGDGEPLPVVEASAPGLKLRLAVADDDKNRELGLMCVTKLKPQTGMIFVFAKSGSWDFWMKNTLVPLDMVWVKADGTIANVAANVPASTRTTPDDAVARRAGEGLYVIELPAGEAAVDRLVPGKHLELPATLHASQ